VCCCPGRSAQTKSHRLGHMQQLELQAAPILMSLCLQGVPPCVLQLVALGCIFLAAKQPRLPLAPAPWHTILTHRTALCVVAGCRVSRPVCCSLWQWAASSWPQSSWRCTTQAWSRWWQWQQTASHRWGLDFLCGGGLLLVFSASCRMPLSTTCLTITHTHTHKHIDCCMLMLSTLSTCHRCTAQ
jgi:hypothetical protein